jgi:exodeoxyribonuclease V alpha subunit
VRARADKVHASDERLEDGVRLLFGEDHESEAAAAVRLAVNKRLAIITGGPGTGKTYCIKRLLALLLLREDPARPLRIALAAPTGKAAVRMAEAMGEGLDDLAVDPHIRDRLRTLTPQTLHKLIGLRPDGSSRHGPERPIPADVIVVDEVSMVDLVLMRTLLEAVDEGARLILLGDRHQLASVEAGSVLSDLMRASERHEPLQTSVVRFTRSHRFRSAPDVAAIAHGLQVGDADHRRAAIEILCRRGNSQGETLPDRIQWLGEPRRTDKGEALPDREQLDRLAQPYLGLVHRAGPSNGPVQSEDASNGPVQSEGASNGPVQSEGASNGPAHSEGPSNGLAHSEGPTLHGYAFELAQLLERDGLRGLFAKCNHPEFELHRKLLSALDHYRVLAVHRQGALGVLQLERELARRIESYLTKSLRAHDFSAILPARGDHFLGRPLMVTENAYDVGLMNGDVGLILPDRQGHLEAVFLRSSSSSSDPLMRVPLSRLPPHEGALAMTVHKSQGSQFDRVAIVLAGRESPIQRRELIYTAITRAKRRVDWLGDELELETALARTVVRTSGLTELILKASSN